ncbi:MAG: TIM barrel protein [Candidatus Micrarchaeota archaeon]|nr:TIM barrel protein [Candidatus Micrarchaeota archaeon]
MGDVEFGPAGIPIAILEKNGDTTEGVMYCRNIGLGAMEVEFVYGVKMSQQAAKEVRTAAEENKVRLSCHAPYYINCCAKEEHKIQASIRHIVSSAQAAFWLGASPVVIHSGYYMGRPQQECRKQVIQTYQLCLDRMEELKIRGVALGAELTGKPSAYGSLDEIIDLAEHFGIDKVMPVIDYAHYHAREARLESKSQYEKVLHEVEKRLGSKAAKDFHCHFSGIEFTPKGEKNHLEVSSNSPPFEQLAKAWKENGWSGRVICESPLLEKDALKLKKIYEKA